MDFEWHLEDRDTGERLRVESGEDLSSWFSDGYRPTDLVLERGQERHVVDLPEFVVDEPSLALEILLELPTPDGVDPRSKYTQGDCEVFAVALEDTFAGQGTGLVAVYDRMEPGSTRITRGAPYLIHAGYQVGGMVFDVDGCHHPEEWAMRWLENGQASEKSGWGPVTRKRLEAMQGQPMTKEETEAAMPYAFMVARLARMVPREDPFTVSFGA